MPFAAALLVYAVAWVFGDLPPSPFRFTDEKIEMNVTADSCAIDGWYRFQNVSPFGRRTRFFYPFPMGDADYPEFIEVMQLRGDVQIPLEFVNLSDGISYYLKIPGRGEAQLIIRYGQKLRAKHAVYIVTTTRTWRRPLDHALFLITHPADFENARYTYPGREIKSDSHEVARLIKWHRHMPDKNIEVRWGE